MNEQNKMDRIISDEEKRKKKIRTAVKATAISLVIGAGIYGVSQFMRSSVSLDNVVISDISRGTIETTINSNGTVVPEFEEAIITPISTKILKVYAQSGEVVEEGTPLLQLDLQAAQTSYAKLLDEQCMKQLQMEQLRANKQTQLSDREMQIKVSASKPNCATSATSTASVRAQWTEFDRQNWPSTPQVLNWSNCSNDLKTSEKLARLTCN